MVLSKPSIISVFMANSNVPLKWPGRLCDYLFQGEDRMAAILRMNQVQAVSPDQILGIIAEVSAGGRAAIENLTTLVD